MFGWAGRACGMGHLLSLRPATAALGQERRRCQCSAGGGFNPLRGPSVACSTVFSLYAARIGGQQLTPSRDTSRTPGVLHALSDLWFARLSATIGAIRTASS